MSNGLRSCLSRCVHTCFFVASELALTDPNQLFQWTKATSNAVLNAREGAASWRRSSNPDGFASKPRRPFQVDLPVQKAQMCQCVWSGLARAWMVVDTAHGNWLPILALWTSTKHWRAAGTLPKLVKHPHMIMITFVVARRLLLIYSSAIST